MTNCAEQEFLSHYFGRTEEWNSLPGSYNFQVHQLFLSGQWWPPAGQERSSVYYQMIQDTKQVKNWHFSGGLEPVHLLCKTQCTEPDVEEFVQKNMEEQASRMEPCVMANRGHVAMLLGVVRQATKEWLKMWGKTLPSVVVNTGARTVGGPPTSQRTVKVLHPGQGSTWC